MKRELVLSIGFGVLVLALIGISSDVGSAVAQVASPAIPAGTAFTYQGKLMDGSQPANGTYNLRFYLWADEGKTTLIGTVTETGTLPVEVVDGLFSVELDFGSGAFNREKRWLEVEVNGTLLTPLQEITPAPYTFYSNGEGLELDGTVFSVDYGGSGSAGTAARSDHDHLGQTWLGEDNSLVISGTFAGYADNHAPLVLENPGGYGLWVKKTESSGVLVSSAGRDGVLVDSAGDDGVSVSSAFGSGVSVYSVGYDGFRVNKVGNVGSSSPDWDNNNGFEVANAEDYGVKVVYAGRAAFRSDDSGTNGLYVADAGDSGVWINNATNWAGHFTGNINVTGNCIGCRMAQFAVNSGGTPLTPGDIVALTGASGNPFDENNVLLQVKAAAAGETLIGVVAGKAEEFTSQEDGTTNLAPRAGEVSQPGDYISIIIYGPVQVRASAVQGAIQAGQRLAASATPGLVQAQRSVEVEGVKLAEDAPVLGIALEALDEGEELIWVLVNPQ